ncbi:MAG: divalent-cation tolerance protein CutA [Bdellovibrionales bacterium]
MPATFLSVYITVPTMAEAQAIARALVEAKLAACVNIFPNVNSVYRWEGKVEEAQEIVLIAKSRTDAFEPLRQKVLNLHPAKCPCIVGLPFTMGHQPFLGWIVKETTP